MYLLKLLAIFFHPGITCRKIWKNKDKSNRIKTSKAIKKKPRILRQCHSMCTYVLMLFDPTILNIFMNDVTLYKMPRNDSFCLSVCLTVVHSKRCALFMDAKVC